jgi:hypothetical protein
LETANILAVKLKEGHKHNIGLLISTVSILSEELCPHGSKMNTWPLLIGQDGQGAACASHWTLTARPIQWGRDHAKTRMPITHFGGWKAEGL